MTYPKFSILHISDLHRVAPANVDCLIASFNVEKEFFRANDIPMPAFIVVSGDIIQGSKEDDAQKAQEEIQKQYEVAGKFLAGLCDIFFDGKRDRMIIVPGNHDVSQYVTRESMTMIRAADYKPFVDSLWNEDSNIRWSWKDLSFYQISNIERYKKRFCDFISFYDDFYKDVKWPVRKYPDMIDEEADIIDFKDEGVTFVCFNSCYQLDHLQQGGYICFNALSRLSLKLLEKKRQGRLIVAVWHHHTQGLPKENNYLNYSILDNMTRYGIKIALHGHQHISGILNEYRDVFTEDNLWLISAGTVYGNSSDMIQGTSRQYNLITLERDGRNCKVTLISREDKSLQNPEPVWENGLIGKSQQIQYSFPVQLDDELIIDDMEFIQQQINMINMEAEKTKDYLLASKRMMELDLTNLAVRKFLLDYLNRANDFETVIKVFAEPKTPSEAIAYIESCIKTRNAEAYYIFRDSKYANETQDANVRAILADADIILKRR